MQRNQLIIRVVVFCCVALDPSCGASEIVAGRQAEADGATSLQEQFNFVSRLFRKKLDD